MKHLLFKFLLVSSIAYLSPSNAVGAIADATISEGSLHTHPHHSAVLNTAGTLPILDSSPLASVTNSTSAVSPSSTSFGVDGCEPLPSLDMGVYAPIPTGNPAAFLDFFYGPGNGASATSSRAGSVGVSAVTGRPRSASFRGDRHGHRGNHTRTQSTRGDLETQAASMPSANSSAPVRGRDSSRGTGQASKRAPTPSPGVRPNSNGKPGVCVVSNIVRGPQGML